MSTDAAPPVPELTPVPTIRPPAFSNASRSTSHWRECDSSAPVSLFWIEKPIGVGSYVWRLSPELKRAPGWKTFRASGSPSVLPSDSGSEQG